MNGDDCHSLYSLAFVISLGFFLQWIRYILYIGTMCGTLIAEY